MKMREICGGYSANVHNITSLTCTLIHVHHIFLDRNSLWWKDINVQAQTHTHTHRSITIKAVRIKYKDAIKLKNPHFKISNFVSVQNEAIFVLNFCRSVLIVRKLQTPSPFWFCFSFSFLCEEMLQSTPHTQSNRFIPIIINGIPIKRIFWVEFLRLILSNNMEFLFSSTSDLKNLDIKNVSDNRRLTDSFK